MVRRVYDVDGVQMVACTGRILLETHARLQALSEQTGRPVWELVGLAVDHAMGPAAYGGGLADYLTDGEFIEPCS